MQPDNRLSSLVVSSFRFEGFNWVDHVRSIRFWTYELLSGFMYGYRHRGYEVALQCLFSSSLAPSAPDWTMDEQSRIGRPYIFSVVGNNLQKVLKKEGFWN